MQRAAWDLASHPPGHKYHPLSRPREKHTVSVQEILLPRGHTDIDPGGAMDAVYRDLLEAQQFSVSVQMPLVRWGARSAEIQAARADLERTQLLAEQSREQLIQEAHFAALQLEQTYRQFLISAKADTVAAKAFEVAHNRYLIGNVPLNDLLAAQNSKDQALTQYVQSMRNYWLAYHRLRRATLE